MIARVNDLPNLHQLGIVVIDEMHVLGDKQRGYHLEILIRLVILFLLFIRLMLLVNCYLHPLSIQEMVQAVN